MDRSQVTEYLSSLTDDEYQELTAEARPEIGKGNVVPGVGNQPPTPPSPVQSAEANGDWRAALALKSQQLVDLAKQQP